MAKEVFAVVFLLVSVFFFSQGHSSSTKDMTLIESVCKKTHDYKLCVSTLKSNPRSFNTDVKGLASIMAGVIQGKITEILTVTGHMGKTASDPRIRDCLNYVCSPEYGTNKARTREAIEYLQSDSLREALTSVSRALDNEEICENCFGEPNERKSPITPINSYFAALCKITEDIITILLH